MSEIIDESSPYAVSRAKLAEKLTTEFLGSDLATGGFSSDNVTPAFKQVIDALCAIVWRRDPIYMRIEISDGYKTVVPRRVRVGQAPEPEPAVAFTEEDTQILKDDARRMRGEIERLTSELAAAKSTPGVEGTQS